MIYDESLPKVNYLLLKYHRRCKWVLMICNYSSVQYLNFKVQTRELAIKKYVSKLPLATRPATESKSMKLEL